MDIWIENSMLPHCYSVNNNATCDLNVENDMPRVISQDETEGGLDGSALTIGILAMLLIGAAFAIIILMRKRKSEDSVFYDEDEWEEEETEDYQDENVTPILPPLAPEKTALDLHQTSLFRQKRAMTWKMLNQQGWMTNLRLMKTRETMPSRKFNTLND